MGIELQVKRGKGKHQEALAVYLHGKYKAWKLERSTLETTWHRLDKQFVCQLPDDTELSEFKSQRPFPMAWEAVWNVTSNVKKAMFPNDYWFGADGMTPEARDTEEVRESLMRDRLKAMKFVPRYEEHLVQLMKLGNSCQVRGWQLQPSRRKDGKDVYEYTARGESGPEKAIYSKPLRRYDGPHFEHISIYDAVIDTRSRDHDTALKMYRIKVPRQTIIDGSQGDNPRYHNTKDLLDMKGGGEEFSSDTQRKSRESERGVSEGSAGEDDTDIDLLVGHGDFTVNGVFYRNHIFEIGNDKHLIRLEPNAYDCGEPPIRFSRLFVNPGETYGFGLLEVNEGIGDLIEVRENQIVDALNLVLNPVFIGGGDGKIDLDNLAIYPGAVIESVDPDAIKPLEMPMQALAGMQDTGRLQAHYMDGTFSHKSFGANVERRTATEVATSAAMMSAVINMLVRKLEEEDLEPLLAFFDELEQQYYNQTSPQSTRMDVGDDTKFQEVSPEVIYQDYRWRAMGSGFTHLEEMRQQKMVMFLQQAAQIPALRFAIDWEFAGKDFLQGMNKRDVERLIPGFPEMMKKGQSGERFSELAPPGGGPQAGAGPSGAPGVPPSQGSPPNRGPQG
jgi:hypothetical protein